MNRRSFLTQSIALGLMLEVTSRCGAAALIPLSKSLAYANFTAYIGQSFYVYGGEKGLRKVVSVDLIEVSQPQPDAKTEQFWVRFRGPQTPVLGKSVYTLEHPATGDKVQLFLEPTENDASGQYYQAVFNLLR